jgi:hypothetical protein
MIASYEVLPSQTATAVDVREAEAVDAGVRVARVHVSWAELEPTPGQYDLSALEDGVARVSTPDSALLLLVETLDSEGFSLPSDLVNPSDRYRLADDRRLDDPVILARYHALIAALTPRLSNEKIFAFSVANEPDTFLDDVPEASSEAIAWVSALAGFTAHARQTIQASLPGTAVGMTLRQTGIEAGLDLGAVIAAGDVALFNYYCQDAGLLVDDPALVTPELDQLLAAAGELPVVLQELGCPAGPDGGGSIIGASHEKQAAFFTAVAARMKAEPRLRAAFVFTGVDWSPALSKEFADYYRNEGYPELGDRFEETLSTWGLLRYADGSPRPSWNAFVAGVASLRNP